MPLCTPMGYGSGMSDTLPGLPHGNGRRCQLTLNLDDARAVAAFRDGGSYPSDSAALVALVRVGLAATRERIAGELVERLGAEAVREVLREELARVTGTRRSTEELPAGWSLSDTPSIPADGRGVLTLNHDGGASEPYGGGVVVHGGRDVGHRILEAPNDEREAFQDAMLAYSARTALDRVGAPTVSPVGAPVSDGWRVRWLAQHFEAARAGRCLECLEDDYVAGAAPSQGRPECAACGSTGWAADKRAGR